MGGVARCSRCNKGVSDYEKWVLTEGKLYHAKCAERLERGRR